MCEKHVQYVWPIRAKMLFSQPIATRLTLIFPRLTPVACFVFRLVIGLLRYLLCCDRLDLITLVLDARQALENSC